MPGVARSGQPSFAATCRRDVQHIHRAKRANDPQLGPDDALLPAERVGERPRLTGLDVPVRSGMEQSNGHHSQVRVTKRGLQFHPPLQKPGILDLAKDAYAVKFVPPSAKVKDCETLCLQQGTGSRRR